MFERYTEKARRVIFFARYEASHYGSPAIETEHLLLGILREDKGLSLRCLKPTGGYEALRSQIDKRNPDCKPTSTAVDLPLSDESRRVLKYAVEESERFSHRHVGTEHLLLGLAREEKYFAAELLRDCGFDPHKLREESSKQHSRDKETFPSRTPYREGPPVHYRPSALDTIDIHGQPRNADYIRRSVKTFREISWHWEKRAWVPANVVIHRQSQHLSFDTSLAENKDFMLVKEGWTKDACAICGWELFASKDAPEHAAGYTNGRDWLCTECYDKFIKRSDFFSSSYPDIT
jgi:Clp amino terminal domain, pathogenicity island component